MKKRLIIITVVIALVFSTFCMVGLTACSESVTYTVTLKLPNNELKNTGFETYKTIQVKEGDVLGNYIENPVSKNKNRLKFAGWYLEDGFATQWNIYTDEVKSNLTLYGKFNDTFSI